MIAALEASGRFRRDSWLGRILHPGTVSFREISATDSLHVVIEGGRVSVHVDEISPLRIDPDPGRPVRYAAWRVVRHTVSDVTAVLGRWARGLHGRHRCNLECDIVWVDDETPLAG
ncbi:MAG: hypothetical protein ACRD0D_13385 [Acidimicrobiales bacterium]